jgi:hypothetical protein
MKLLDSLNGRRVKQDDYKDHWSQLIEGMQFPSGEFYQKVERALEARQVPGLTFSRVTWREGGPMSAKRDYLRIKRERLIFDVCAMPFGTGFYVAEWFIIRPLRLGLVALIILAMLAFGFIMWEFGRTSALWNVYYFFYAHFGIRRIATINRILLGVPITLAIICVLFFGQDLDAALMRLPLIGYFYERIRKVTFYRADLAAAYRAAVHNAVCEAIDEVSKSKGIAPLSELAKRLVNIDLAGGPRRPQPQQGGSHALA